MTATAGAAAAPGKVWTDFHVHAIPFDDSHGCIASPWYRASRLAPLARRMRLGRARGTSANDAYLEHLLELVETSRFVERAVLLAMDAAYSEDAVSEKEVTHFFIPDEYVFAWCRRTPRFLPGISVHPSRPDALEALERGAAAGAVLVKWLPNTQHIDPLDPAHGPFYAKLADLGLPLLLHSGSEFSVAGSRHELGHADTWEGPLAAGVTVIGAHAGSCGSYFRERHLQAVRGYLTRYPNFYLDSSASVANRSRMLGEVARMPESRGRVVFASDFPVPASVLPWHSGASLGALRQAYAERNELDRHFLLQRALGIEHSQEATAALLSLPRTAAS